MNRPDRKDISAEEYCEFMMHIEMDGACVLTACGRMPEKHAREGALPGFIRAKAEAAKINRRPYEEIF